MEGFPNLLKRVSGQEFLDRYFETAAYLELEADPERSERYVSLADFDAFMAAGHEVLQPPSLLVKRDGHYIPAPEYSNRLLAFEENYRVLDMEKVLKLYQDGQTAVFYSIHRHFPRVQALCEELERFFGLTVHANAYLSPPNCVAGRLHYDAHDVFVLQIAGRKTWRSYRPPVELPVEGQSKSFSTGEPEHEFMLEPGSLVYLPRGFPHETTTSADMSLHVTIGVAPTNTYADLIGKAAARLARQDVRMRRVIRPGSDASVAEVYADLVRALADVDPLAMVAESRRGVEARQRVDMRGRLLSLTKAQELHPETRLRVRDAEAPRVSEVDETLTLHLPGREIVLAKAHRKVIDRLEKSRAAPVTAAGLHEDLDGELSMSLARYLVRSGYLTICE